MQTHEPVSKTDDIRDEIETTTSGLTDTANAIKQASAAELLADLLRQISRLMRQEFALARTELTEAFRDSQQDAALVAAGGVLGLAAMFTATSALIEIVASVLPRWLASLVVSGALGAAGGTLAKRGIDGLRGRDLVPRQTLASLEEIQQQAKDMV